MMGLMIKDCLALKKYSRTLVLIGGFYLIWGFAMNNSYMLGGMLTLLCSMMVLTSFYYDDNAKWDIYALTMPLTRRDLVTSKYLLSILLVVVGAILSLISTILLLVLKKQPITQELYMTILALAGLAVFYQSVTIPLIIKVGVEKARIGMFAVFLVPTLIIFGISRLGIKKPSEAFLHLLVKWLPWIGCISLFLLFVISYYISIYFMEHKEI